eukprot:2062792-Prorocentrum_lima.AAC.1
MESIEKHQGLGSVCGGGGTNIIKHKATVPIGVSEPGNATYGGSMLESSEVPALLGLRTIEARMGSLTPVVVNNR